MTNIFQPLLLLFAGATQKELARQVKFLKVENEILRSKLPKRVAVTSKERQRLVKFAAKLGAALHILTTIVTPSTLLRWIREERKSGKRKEPAPRGRPRTPLQLRNLVLRLARENEWGYTRILGELKKLGIFSLSKNTIKRILKERGLDPGPKRGEGTWDEFLKRHAVSLWQCDFLSKRTLTIKGFRDLYVLAFLHLETRQVVVSPSTFHPGSAWVVQQAESFVAQARSRGLRVAQVQVDRDTKFSSEFRKTLKRLRVTLRLTAIRSPNTNAFVERFIQTLQQECLDHFITFGERHLNYLCQEFVEYYHRHRPHQALENEPVVQGRSKRRTKHAANSLTDRADRLGSIRCEQKLGGVLRSYHNRAA